MNRLLTGIGLVLTLFGVVGIVDGLDNGGRRHPGTLVVSEDPAAHVPGDGAAGVLPVVHVHLDDIGTTLNADITKLAAAVGADGTERKVAVQTRDHDKVVERVRFRGTWYGTAATAASVRLAIAFLLVGLGLLALLIFLRRRPA